MRETGGNLAAHRHNMLMMRRTKRVFASRGTAETRRNPSKRTFRESRITVIMENDARERAVATHHERRCFRDVSRTSSPLSSWQAPGRRPTAVTGGSENPIGFCVWRFRSVQPNLFFFGGAVFGLTRGTRFVSTLCASSSTVFSWRGFGEPKGVNNLYPLASGRRRRWWRRFSSRARGDTE